MTEIKKAIISRLDISRFRAQIFKEIHLDFTLGVLEFIEWNVSENILDNFLMKIKNGFPFLGFWGFGGEMPSAHSQTLNR